MNIVESTEEVTDNDNTSKSSVECFDGTSESEDHLAASRSPYGEQIERTRQAAREHAKNVLIAKSNRPPSHKERTCHGRGRVVKKNSSVSERTSISWSGKSVATCERLRDLKVVVENAIAQHKTFSVIGAFPSIREALKQRGWIEKIIPPRIRRHKPHIPIANNPSASNTSTNFDDADDMSLSMHDLPEPSSTTVASGCKGDDVLMTRLLRHSPVDFFWSMRSDTIEWRELTKKQIVNRFPRAYFTTKVGLCGYMQQMHWYCETGVSQILFPRCYNIGQGEELAAFKNDYQLTACLSLLKWLVTTCESQGEKAVMSIEGRIPTTVVDFAIARCNEYISTQAHEDIDQDDDVQYVWGHQWDQFLTCYYMIANENHLLTEQKDPILFKDMLTRSEATLVTMKRHWPQLSLDGLLNIWIVKPGNKSRGRGIILMNKLEDIMAKVNPAVSKETRYVVQKYIEHPLLIYNTKFDIRQWFLVTSAHPLTVWMYKESYLRFCSQSFSLHNMHESVHLCNNAVQCRYKNGKRDSTDLPDENMWDCYTFKTYLRTIGHADMWEEHIYPGMREGIIGALLASQEHMDRRQNCFELFGADFMLTEDFNPWLIEINSCPCMAPSTSVTARMCAQCLEDVIKVVVDRRHNKHASTGMFELIYKQHVPPAPAYLGMSLSLRGKKIMKGNHTKKKSPKRFFSDDGESTISSHSETKEKIKGYIGPIIVDMIDDLARHLDNAARGNKMSETHDKEKIVDVVVSRDKAPKPDVCQHKLEKSDTETTPKKKMKKHLKKSNKSSSKKLKKCVKGRRKSVSDSDEFKEISQSSEDDYSQSDKNKSFKNRTPEKTWSNPSKANEYFESVKNKSKQSNIENGKLLLEERLRTAISVNTPDIEKVKENVTESQKTFNKTRYSCEALLAKLKLFKENDGMVTKPKYYSLEKGINWEGELGDKPTICDIVSKLSLSEPEREFFMDSKGRGFMQSLPGYTLPATTFSESKSRLKSKDEAKRQPSFLNVMIDNELATNRIGDKVGKSLGQRLRVNPQVYSSIVDKSGQVRSSLPIIRQKSKLNTSNDFNSSRSMDNFYAVGMSLRTISNSLNQKESIILPLGNVPSLDVTATSEMSTGKFV